MKEVKATMSEALARAAEQEEQPQVMECPRKINVASGEDVGFNYEASVKEEA